MNKTDKASIKLTASGTLNKCDHLSMEKQLHPLGINCDFIFSIGLYWPQHNLGRTWAWHRRNGWTTMDWKTLPRGIAHGKSSGCTTPLGATLSRLHSLFGLKPRKVRSMTYTWNAPQHTHIWHLKRPKCDFHMADRLLNLKAIRTHHSRLGLFGTAPPGDSDLLRELNPQFNQTSKY